MRILSAVALVGALLVAGCSGGDDGLDRAAAPASSGANAPPDNPNKVISIAPPLAGPNAGKGSTAGDR